MTATRKTLDTSFDIKNIESITDTGMQKILKTYLLSKGNNPEIAFSPEGIEDMNKDIKKYNDGKDHKPILKVRVFEIGSKFNLGQIGNKSSKFVEAAKGTNLYFAIYEDNKGNRNFETIPLYIIIDRLKKKLSPVPDINEKGNQLLMWLSPNDLVYLPTDEEIDKNIKIEYRVMTKLQKNNIYKFVSCTGGEGHFVPAYYSKEILKNEMGTNNKSERPINQSGFNKLLLIKDHCIKLKVDRLGNIEPYPVFNPSSLKKI